MTSRTHLLRAIALAATADERLTAAMDETAPLPLPERLTALKEALASAAVGELHLGVHRELWMEEGDPLAAPALGVAAPVLNLPMRPDTRTADPVTPGTAADTPASHPYERNES